MKTKSHVLISGLLVSLLMLVVASPLTALANGGTIVFAQNVGPYNVVVTRSPTPATPNVSLHLSILITCASSPQKVTDATVIVSPSMPGMEMPGSVPVRAYRGQTENTYDVDIPVNMEGIWQFDIQIISPQYGQATFILKDTVEKPEAPWAIIIAILIGLPMMAGLTWFLLFRKTTDAEEDDKEDSSPTGQQTRKS
jgi:hypothetical protein